MPRNPHLGVLSDMPRAFHVCGRSRWGTMAPVLVVDLLVVVLLGAAAAGAVVLAMRRAPRLQSGSRPPQEWNARTWVWMVCVIVVLVVLTVINAHH
jgi:hypothetical protein